MRYHFQINYYINYDRIAKNGFTNNRDKLYKISERGTLFPSRLNTHSHI